MIETPTQTATACPSCASTGMRVFYETGPVPVHSCLMLDDQRAAREFVRRPISLGFCAECGFVANVAFDPDVHNYAGDYEDQQSFSKRFCEFQTSTVEKLIERFGISNKNVVEIGCGKGDFLLELCRRGNNRGVGIDPRSSLASQDSSANVRFIRSYYSPEHWDMPCDLLVCRHTLEHLHQTDRFLADVRKALESKAEALVFFEVPDTARVYREAAFWDIYYEHCSYFTPGSLARLFRRNRFEIIELQRVFEGQYLTIVARPAEQPTMDSLAVEEQPAELERDVNVFAIRAAEKIAAWKRELAVQGLERKHVAAWGAGSKCVSFLSTLQCEDAIQTVVDINPRQQNRFLPGSGKRIASPDVLRDRRPDTVLVMNPVYRTEIGRQLESMGIAPELLACE